MQNVTDVAPGISPFLLPINNTCATLGVGRNKVYDLIRDGKLKTVKIGRRTLVKVDSIRAFAAAA